MSSLKNKEFWNFLKHKNYKFLQTLLDIPVWWACSLMKLVCIPIHFCPSDVFCLPSQTPSAPLKVRSFCRFLLPYWKSGPSTFKNHLYCWKSGPFCIWKITILCIWKDLEGSNEAWKCLSPSQAYLLTCPQVKQDIHYLESKTM